MREPVTKSSAVNCLRRVKHCCWGEKSGNGGKRKTRDLCRAEGRAPTIFPSEIIYFIGSGFERAPLAAESNINNCPRPVKYRWVKLRRVAGNTSRRRNSNTTETEMILPAKATRKPAALCLSANYLFRGRFELFTARLSAA